jgi:hypothetical protein
MNEVTTIGLDLAKKAAALAMAKGACGDHRVTNAIAHLNGLAARLLDAEAA